ncbi:Uncharacterized membrane protein [Cetobacterium ceti]|uniref:Uncharacterized membrane protein n=1 Tax=Cetobacterium ceti TaxID=180163 RepID=A0A1T4JWX7_9FUSO|nr:YibE/F family protein [Cetobacterium ceti]SJZ34649.1 Uncharacterized membrane protein [Cetobacterium ceti]
MRKIWILLLLIGISLISFSREEYIKGKVLQLIESKSEKDNNEISEIKIFKIELLDKKEYGEKVYVEFPIYRENSYNIEVKPGMNVVLYKDNQEDGTSNFYIADVDKRNSIYLLSGLFVGLTLILARKKGLKALISLGIVIGVIYEIFIPGIVAGYSPIILASLTGLFASLVTIYLMTGFTEKGINAILGSVVGVLFAGLLSYIFTYKMGLTGFVSVESLNFANLLQGIKIKEIISAGVILGSMGAVMDISMSISSALDEIKLVKPEISKKEIFFSGMRIGGDVIGTMVNTLILAYIGSSLLSAIFIFLQRSQYPLIRLLNFESVVVEILRALCGSIGILVAVPVTAYFSSIINIKNEK